MAINPLYGNDDTETVSVEICVVTVHGVDEADAAPLHCVSTVGNE